MVHKGEYFWLVLSINSRVYFFKNCIYFVIFRIRSTLKRCGPYVEKWQNGKKPPTKQFTRGYKKHPKLKHKIPKRLMIWLMYFQDVHDGRSPSPRQQLHHPSSNPQQQMAPGHTVQIGAYACTRNPPRHRIIESPADVLNRPWALTQKELEVCVALTG